MTFSRSDILKMAAAAPLAAAAAPAMTQSSQPRAAGQWRVYFVKSCWALAGRLEESENTNARSEGMRLARVKISEAGMVFPFPELKQRYLDTDALVRLIKRREQAPRGQGVFAECENALLAAEGMGLGSADLRRIAVAGTPIEEARYLFRRA